MSLSFRPARPGDLELLQRWDEDPDVVASDPKDDWNWAEELGREPEWREFWIAELDGRPIGFLQIIDAAEEESHYWGTVESGAHAIDIWIGEPWARGRGHGTAMMRFAIDRCFRHRRATVVLIDPLVENHRAHAFYERLGFRFIEERDFGGDRCRVYALP